MHKARFRPGLFYWIFFFYEFDQLLRAAEHLELFTVCPHFVQFSVPSENIPQDILVILKQTYYRTGV